MLATALFTLAPALALASPIGSRAENRPRTQYVNQVIQSYRTGTCLTLEPGVAPYDGAPLTVGDCTTATRWTTTPESGSIVITGTNFALDAGTDPHDFVGAKVWTSYPGLPQQTWYITADERIAITGGTQCLDEGDNGPQTYTCTTGDTNQIWYISPAGSPAATSTATTAPTASPTATRTYPYSTLPPPGYTGYPTTPQPIVFVGADGSSRCFDTGSQQGFGTPVTVEPCQPGLPTQQWYYRADGSIMAVAAADDGGAFCLDAGSNPSNGTPMKLWQCYSGLPQQTWTYLDSDQTQLQTSNNQCLDVQLADGKTLQTWECSASDPQQEFELNGYQGNLRRRR